MHSAIRRVMAETGQDCPATGLWEATCRPGEYATFYRGDIIPPREGRAVVWELVPEPSGDERPEG
ncbi:MAG: hypothetical protein HY916_07555 [Desulfovibrio sp.]|nr:hypothetical protein [Desulfovibrio sp.]